MVNPEIPEEVRRAGERARRTLEAAASSPDPQQYLAAVGAAAQEAFDAAVLAGLVPLESDDRDRDDPDDDTTTPRSTP